MAFLNQYLPIYETPPLPPTYSFKEVWNITDRLTLLHANYNNVFLHIYQSYMACNIGY